MFKAEQYLYFFFFFFFFLLNTETRIYQSLQNSTLLCLIYQNNLENRTALDLLNHYDHFFHSAQNKIDLFQVVDVEN